MSGVRSSQQPETPGAPGRGPALRHGQRHHGRDGQTETCIEETLKNALRLMACPHSLAVIVSFGRRRLTDGEI